MKNTFLKGAIVALSLSAVTQVSAAELDSEALTNSLVATPAAAEILVADAIDLVCENKGNSQKPCANPSAVEEILVVAITTLGADSPLIANILTLTVDSGADADTVTAIAVANGVDATIASEATAAGGQGNPNPGRGNGNSGRGNGNGGGGGGISTNQ
ncbi:MAG: hypothetical protein ACPGTQ_13440 [Colwellia sp.]